MFGSRGPFFSPRPAPPTYVSSSSRSTDLDPLPAVARLKERRVDLQGLVGAEAAVLLDVGSVGAPELCPVATFAARGAIPTRLEVPSRLPDPIRDLAAGKRLFSSGHILLPRRYR